MKKNTMLDTIFFTRDVSLCVPTVLLKIDLYEYSKDCFEFSLMAMIKSLIVQ